MAHTVEKKALEFEKKYDEEYGRDNEEEKQEQNLVEIKNDTYNEENQNKNS